MAPSSNTPGGRRPRGAVLTATMLVGTLGLSGCGTSAGLLGRADDEPSAGRSLLMERSEHAVGRHVPFEAQTWSVTDEAHRVMVQLPELTGTADPAAVARLYQPYVRSFLAQRAAAPAPRPDEAAPSLSIQWHAAAVSDALVGLVVDTDEFGGADATDDRHLHWVDRRTGHLLGWRDLIDPAAHGAFSAAVGRALAGNASVDTGELDRLLAGRTSEERSPAMRTTAAGTEPSVAFDDDGSLFLLIPEGVVAPYATGPVVARIPSESTASLLSAQGRAARAATMESHGTAGGGRPGDDTSAAAPATPGDADPTARRTDRGDTAPTADCTQVRCVALTFDDGPDPTTDAVLDVLRRRHVRATFFMVGSQVSHHPDVARRVAAAGHEIGAHGWNHTPFTGLDATAVRDQIGRTSDMIQQVTGQSPAYLRPPYGAHTTTSDQVAAQTGLPIVLWNVDSSDWRSGDAKAIRAQITRGVRPGSIVLLHDVRPATVRALPGVVDDLRADGYTLVPLRDILDRPTPGAVVHTMRPAR